jgi:hypothetical protein
MQTFFTGPVQHLLTLLDTAEFAAVAADLGGYDLASSGRIINA